MLLRPSCTHCFCVTTSGGRLYHQRHFSLWVENIPLDNVPIGFRVHGPGVKLVMPSLLAGVESKAWRSKQGSAQMLGAMAHCAPKQLGTALPSVVPKLSEILGDPHPKVQSAARQALKEVRCSIPAL